MSDPELPEGVRLLKWAGKADFARQRAQWRSGVLKSADLIASEKVVLCLLADYFSADKSEAWPGLATLAAEAKLSERSVWGAITKGCRVGHIEKQRGGFSESSRYRLAWASSSFSQQVARMDDDDASFSQPVASHSRSGLRAIPAAGCDLTCSLNPIMEPGEVHAGKSEAGECGRSVDLLGEKKDSVTVENKTERSCADKPTEKNPRDPDVVRLVRDRRFHEIVGEGSIVVAERREKLLGDVALELAARLLRNDEFLASSVFEQVRAWAVEEEDERAKADAARGELVHALGRGDIEAGERRAADLAPDLIRRLVRKVEAEGVDGAASEIHDAIVIADNELEQRQKNRREA